MTHSYLTKSIGRTLQIWSPISGSVLLCACLLAAVFVLLPISAHAQCKNWDASGVWEIKQRGLNYGIIVTLQQNGRALTGFAEVSTNKKYGRKVADGTVDGDRLSLQIFWQDGSVGVYNANFLPSGRLDGTAYEKKTPNITHMWHSQNPLKCAPSTPPAEPGVLTRPTTTPKVFKGTGKARKTKPAPPAMTVPGIVASQVFYPNINANAGIVVLTWDAGPDHPYAEVWFKVNNGEEAFLVEQAKGSRQVAVERGRAYTYILTDAGKTLATVVVVGQ